MNGNLTTFCLVDLVLGLILSMRTYTVHVGVDVGGTNTDAVILHENTVISWFKCVTTVDVRNGIKCAIYNALLSAQDKLGGDVGLHVSRIHIGTTHFINAILQLKDLTRVSIIRLCGLTSRALPPYADFPNNLAEIVAGPSYMLDGGYEFNGVHELATVNESEIIAVTKSIVDANVKNMVISGVFSPVNNKQELQIAELIKSTFPDVSLTLSHEIGGLDLLARENAAVLNECLKPVCCKTVSGVEEVLVDIGLAGCPLFWTCNDGTVVNSERVLQFPVHTIASGATNSLRGAAFLSGIKDAVVVDIGGTSTDVGMLVNGFPRPAAVRVKVGNVQTNFRMPDLICIGLGGGSLIRVDDSEPIVGPQSVGFKLEQQSMVFGGSILTATDMAVANGLVNIGNPELVKHVSRDLVTAAISKIHQIIENVVDSIKVSKEDVPVLVVGGGSVLIDCKRSLKGCSQLIQSDHFAVANAVGAGISQVSGTIEMMMDLNSMHRDDAHAVVKDKAISAAIQAGADPTSIQLIEIDEVGLQYLPGNVLSIRVKAVGDLMHGSQQEIITWLPKNVEFEDAKVCESEKSTFILPLFMAEEPKVEEQWHEDYVPNIDSVSGMWTLSPIDIDFLSVGAGILGCGGGGSPYSYRLISRRLLDEGKKIVVISPEKAASYDADKYIVPAFAMGAPAIGMERMTSMHEYCAPMQCFANLLLIGKYNNGTLFNSDDVIVNEKEGVKYIDDYQPTNYSTDMASVYAKISAIYCGEVGGSNCFNPLIVGALSGLPVVDCDSMGRAFPEVQQLYPLFAGVLPYPAILCDYRGRHAVILKVDSLKLVEKYFRQVCIDMGCEAMFLNAPLKSDEILSKTILYSISRAWRIGHAVLLARCKKSSPIDAILSITNGKLLCRGKISKLCRDNTKGGFTSGFVLVERLHDQSFVIKINFQNEYLVARDFSNSTEGKVLACTPDLITIVEHDSGQPIQTSELRYGLRVVIIVMAAPPELRTAAGLKVFGPQAFGYSEDDVKYSSDLVYVEYGSLCQTVN